MPCDDNTNMGAIQILGEHIKGFNTENVKNLLKNIVINTMGIVYVIFEWPHYSCINYLMFVCG